MQQIVFGKVEQASDKELVILANGIKLTTEDIYIDHRLLSGYVPGLAGTLYGSGYCAGADCGNIPVSATASGAELSFAKAGLSKGDLVVMVTQDEQEYVILCKAVRYG